ncbi:MAG: hypothetical protein NWQ09_08065 [Nonlabens sp.]|nr:hypothetical protein [Nonlabens sp.]
MNHFKEIMRYAKPYKRYAILNIICNVFFALFGALSFVSLIPMLDVLFDKTLEITVQPEWTGIFDAMKYMKAYAGWYLTTQVSGGKETVAFSPNGHELAFAQNNEVVKLWNFNSNAVRTLRHSNDETRSYLGDYITSLAYSPNGRYLAVASHVATIKLWRLVPVYNDDDNNNDYSFSYYYDYEQKIHLGPGWSAVMHIQFTPDSSYIACSNHGSQIRLLHVETGAVVANLLGHTGRIEALSFTNNGRTLASGSCDRTVRLWNMSAYYLNHV